MRATAKTIATSNRLDSNDEGSSSSYEKFLLPFLMMFFYCARVLLASLLCSAVGMCSVRLSLR